MARRKKAAKTHRKKIYGQDKWVEVHKQIVLWRRRGGIPKENVPVSQFKKPHNVGFKAKVKQLFEGPKPDTQPETSRDTLLSKFFDQD